MNFTTKTSLVGFLLALSTLSLPDAATATPPEKPTIEGRLTRLTEAVRERESQLNHPSEPIEGQIARGWADGRGRSWVNGRGLGWSNGNNWRNGNWRNGNNWRNGWSDRGGFFNNSGGGGFLNRR